MRETLRALLALEGYPVAEAANGRKALDFLLRNPKQPCLILLDLMMPVMDGWQFLEVRRDNVAIASIPLAIVSAVVDRQRIPPGVQYLHKPVDIEALLQIVKAYCREPLTLPDRAHPK